MHKYTYICQCIHTNEKKALKCFLVPLQDKVDTNTNTLIKLIL